MVIAKPMLFTIVNAVPLVSDFVLWATSVENSGESATTIIPQKRRNIMNTIGGLQSMAIGDIKQQVPENANAVAAVFFEPKLCER